MKQLLERTGGNNLFSLQKVFEWMFREKICLAFQDYYWKVSLLNQSWKCSFWTLLNVRDARTTSPRAKLGVKLWVRNNWYRANSQMFNYSFQILFHQNFNCTRWYTVTSEISFAHWHEWEEAFYIIPNISAPRSAKCHGYARHILVKILAG